MYHAMLTSRRPLMAAAVLALAIMACNLDSLGSQEPTPTPITRPLTQPPLNLTLTPLGTPQFVVRSPTPAPTRAGAATPIPAVQQPVNCTPQTTWPIYTVVVGDTLGLIAERTGSTVAQLQQANCLSNADLIYAGDRLYVPRLPVVPTAVATQGTQVPFQPGLAVVPYWLDATGRPVTYSDTIRISAGEVLNATAVTFYVNDPNGGAPITIGQDVDPYDGAFIDYSFFAPGTYTFTAITANETTQTTSAPFTIRYDPGFVPPEGIRNQLGVSPFLSFVDGWVTLQPGATVTVRWPDAPVGALRVDFGLAPTGTDSATQIIGSDTNMTDGAYISWGVPSGISGHLQGFATMPDGSVQTSEILNITTAQ